ncbi:MAG: MFS transporter, partial [Nocardioidaceae bacterium]
MTSARPDSTETGSAEPDSPDPAGRLLSRAFAIWLGAATLAAVGDGILYFAVGWTASGLGAHTAGIVLTLGLLPRTVLLLIGGATGDRWGLRRTMIGCDAFMCVVLVAFLAAEHTPVPTIGLLAGLELVTGIASSFRMPAAGAYPRLFVDEARLPRAMSLTGSMLEVARLVGPPLGGVLVGLLAMTGAVTATLAGVVLILVVLVTVRPPYEQPPEPDESSALHRIKEGLLAARRVSGVMPLLGAVGLLAAGVIPMLSLCVPLA